MVLPLFLLVISALVFFGRVLYVKIALDMTSYDACRAAVEALQPGDGVSQGLIAGQATLQGILPESCWRKPHDLAGRQLDARNAGTLCRGLRLVRR